MQWKNCIGLCTDGARAMAGQYNVLQGLVKLLPQKSNRLIASFIERL
jgi:hypothetical protein